MVVPCAWVCVKGMSSNGWTDRPTDTHGTTDQPTNQSTKQPTNQTHIDHGVRDVGRARKRSVEGISRGLQQLGAEVAVKASLDRRVINIGRGAALLALDFGGRCGACAMGGGVDASVLVEAATVGATSPGEISVFCLLVMVPRHGPRGAGRRNCPW
jgi:hypothetical protein